MMLTSANTEADFCSWQNRLHPTAAGSGVASAMPSCCETMVGGSCCRNWFVATPATHPTSSTSCSPTGATVPSRRPLQPLLLRKQVPTPSPLGPDWRKFSPSAGIPTTHTREAASTPKPPSHRHPPKPANLLGSH